MTHRQVGFTLYAISAIGAGIYSVHDEGYQRLHESIGPAERAINILVAFPVAFLMTKYVFSSQADLVSKLLTFVLGINLDDLVTWITPGFFLLMGTVGGLYSAARGELKWGYLEPIGLAALWCAGVRIAKSRRQKLAVPSKEQDSESSHVFNEKNNHA